MENQYTLVEHLVLYAIYNEFITTSYVSSNFYNKLHSQCFLQYQQAISYLFCRRYIKYVAHTAVKTIHLVLYSEPHILCIFLCGKCSVWKKGQYGSSWVKKPLVIPFTECWWPITQAGRKGNRDLYQMIATWEDTCRAAFHSPHCWLTRICDSFLSSRGVLWPTRTSLASPLHCNSLQHFLKAHGLARVKIETTGSKTNSTRQKTMPVSHGGFPLRFQWVMKDSFLRWALSLYR